MTGACVRLVLGIAMAGLLALPVAAQDWVYRASPGDNLWNLAEEYLLDGARFTTRLQRHNNIADPTHIPPGTLIRLPIRWLKQQPAAARLVRKAGSVTVLTAASGVPQPAVQGAA